MITEKAPLVLLASQDPGFIEEVSAYLKDIESSSPSFSWEILSCTPPELTRYAGSRQPDILFLDLDSLPEKFAGLIGDITKVFVHSDVICSKTDLEVSEVLRLLKLGVKDFFKRRSLQNDFKEYLEKWKNTPRRSQAGSKEKGPSGKILAVFSPKGGSGTTLFAVNLAADLLRCSGQRTMVCDLSSGCGDVVTYLNLHPSYTIRDVLNHADLIDGSFLDGSLVRHASGLEVLAAAREDQEPVSSSNFMELQKIFSCLRAMSGYVVVDLGGRDVSLVQMVLSQADMIFLMGTLDMLSMKGMVSFFNKLRKMHFSQEKVTTVINRFDAKNQLNIIKDFEKNIGNTIAFRLPNCYALCIRALNEGKLLEDVQPRSALGRKIEEIARAVHGPDGPGAGSLKAHPAMSFLKKLGA